MLQRAPLRPNAKRRPVARTRPLPFPVGGWDAASPLSAMPEDRAVQLKNWFPRPGYGEIRRGYVRHAYDVGTDTSPVESLMAWRGPASSKMFAASGAAIYDVTTASTAASSALTGLNNARWQHVNITTGAGHYLWICNGADDPRHFNGSVWATPSLTGVTATSIVHVNSHKKRLWFTILDSLTAYYLATDAVAGAATSFALGSVFTRGGHLVAMGTWSRDGGSGPDDYAVFVSSEGQVALYQGTDPASANTWALVGTYDVPAPIGRRCFVKYGADLALITLEGVFPLSQLLSVDQSQAGRVALTANISPAFNSAARSYASVWGWEAIVYPRGTRLIVNIPSAENSASSQYVMNTLTGAWCEFDGHTANCWLVYDDNLYFGGNTGSVFKADTGSLDFDQPITATGQTAYTALGTAQTKRWLQCRALVTGTGAFRPQIGISTDFYETSLLSPGSASALPTSALFGSAVFGTSVFGASVNVSSDWVGMAGIGAFGSIKFVGRVGYNASIAGGEWSTATWGASTWGANGSVEESLVINGFLVMAETGGAL
jgi:hypothetical protein